MTVQLPGALGRLQAEIARSNHHPAEQLPKTVGGGFGNVPAAPIDTTKEIPEPRRLSPRQAEQLMQAELVDAIRSLVESSTEIAGRLQRRGAVNGVLDVWAGVLPTGGTITRTYEIVAGSMRVTNHGTAGFLTVQSGVAAGDTGAQSAGTGVQYIAAGATHSFPLGDRSWTITGTAADRVSLQVFTGLQALGVSAL